MDTKLIRRKIKQVESIIDYHGLWAFDSAADNDEGGRRA